MNDSVVLKKPATSAIVRFIDTGIAAEAVSRYIKRIRRGWIDNDCDHVKVVKTVVDGKPVSTTIRGFKNAVRRSCVNC